MLFLLEESWTQCPSEGATIAIAQPLNLWLFPYASGYPQSLALLSYLTGQELPQEALYRCNIISTNAHTALSEEEASTRLPCSETGNARASTCPLS